MKHLKKELSENFPQKNSMNFYVLSTAFDCYFDVQNRQICLLFFGLCELYLNYSFRF